MDKKTERAWAGTVCREASRKGAVYPWNVFGLGREENYRPESTAAFPTHSRETSYVEDISKASTSDFLPNSPSPVSSPKVTNTATSPSPPLKDEAGQTTDRQQYSLSRVLGADSCNPYKRCFHSSAGKKEPLEGEGSQFFTSGRREEKENAQISQMDSKDVAEPLAHLQQTLSAADLLESDKSKSADFLEDLDGSQSLRSALEFLQLLTGDQGSEATTEKLQSRLDLIQGRFGAKGKTLALKIIKDVVKEPLNATYSDKFSGVVTWGQLGLGRQSLTLPKPTFGNSWNEEMKNVTNTLGTFMGAVHQLRDDLSSLRAAATKLK